MKLAESGAGVATSLADIRAAIAGARARITEVEEEQAAFVREEALVRLEIAEHEAARESVAAAEEAAANATARAREALTGAEMAEAGHLGVSREWLVEPVGPAKEPRWMTLTRVEIRASRGGLLTKLHAASGAWVEEGGPIATVIDRHALRFRADVLQSDLHRIADGAAARIVPPDAGTRRDGALVGVATPLPGGDPQTRTSTLLVACTMPETHPAWVRDGVVALVEIRIAGGDETLAIPERCVVRDGLERVYFRRDPNDADKAIRVVADLGASDGYWVAVKSGVAAGNEVVMEGAYPLSLTGGGKNSQAGHFHADGTFHSGEDE